MKRLKEANTEVYRTDIHGDIVITTDGSNYDIKLNPIKQEIIKNESAKDLQNKNGININTATLEELQGIIHIGLAYAHQIIEIRPFTSIDELVKINGISVGRLKDIIEEGKAYVE
ncbi:ComEA family DNA-binding protein [Alkaliphilus transvaalensis]|uniref:ComEA family DNA-binding protein n=1 Tax=Alkaliphilus transvaalensis TaxID=114628 RepID=UPI000478C02D|nr:helix-hairpin-helix domain-containing protein [Alkaliphilus transvaalensis]